MRYTAVINLCLAVFTIQGKAQTESKMFDPLFRIPYDTREVHFEYAPDSLEERCPGLRQGGRWWVYAHWKENGAEFYILSSLKAVYRGGGAVITKDGCTVGGSSWVLTGAPEDAPKDLGGGRSRLDKDIKFTPSVLHGLASDFLRRCAEAFGGKRKFLEAAKKVGIVPDYDDFPPELGEEFRKFANQP